MTTAQDGGKFVGLKHRPPLLQKVLLVLISVRGWNCTDKGKPSYSERNLLSVFSPTENLTWDDVGSNQSLRIERPATNRLNRGTELRNQIKFNYICNPLT